MERKIYYGSRGVGNVLKMILPYLVIVGAFQALGAWVAGYDLTTADAPAQNLEQAFIIVFFSLLGNALLIGLFRRYVDRESFLSLGFQTTFLGKDLLIGIIVGFEVMFLGFMALTLTDQLDFITFQYSFADLLLCLGFYIVVAFTEELLMRGYVLNNLLLSFDKYVALAISALLFSLMHGFNANFTLLGGINLFLAGILLGLSYIFTKNLWFPIALHFSWNFFQGPIFGFNVSGNNFYNLFLTEYSAPTIWNGGAFGFEGSIVCLFFQLIAILAVYVVFKDRFSPERERTLALEEQSTPYYYDESTDL
ncbi:CPBP family intramembrane glutamic endopeptidase [Salmonirosea aquatica]|uniref:CPBP family intramembrane metalloprotease n=1 Tax=Salmonirosea aquatica TaxID=2654236 RepID=A0A7C9BP23_9BACT|nr:CPBP family intramembrane metalloprotease [Cytophagaceae bacterium SJW1-29]